ncbi:MAG: SDR family NAD(P)-dependent oxidoreductase [Actinomycetota bacterium]|nr:SDR family NAD(P)-dependent oxidoreductase [Actinomycetota bacterium]
MSAHVGRIAADGAPDGHDHVAGAPREQVVEQQDAVTSSPFIHPPRPIFGTPPPGPAAAEPGPDDPGSAEPSPAPLEGKLAVVTGATGLLGATVAAELVARGARVCLLGRSIDELRETARRCGDATAVLRCDLAISDDVAEAADFVERIGAPVDVLVHAAGVRSSATVRTGTLESLDEHYLLNVRGPYLLTQRLLGSLGQARGQVVFFASSSRPDLVLDLHGGDAHHAISTAALVAFADELRAEAAPAGVRVLTVDAEVDLGPDEQGDEVLAALAAQVIDALGSPRLDVTGFSVRSTANPSRTVRQ